MISYFSLIDAITDIFGSGRTITEKRPIAGGDINEASVLTLDDGTMLFMKANRPDFAACYEAEAAGLGAIKDTGAIGVPNVLGIGQDKQYSFLLLEYVRSERRRQDFWEVFARELAAMHGAETDKSVGYGFFHDNWIGATRQRNRPHDSWVTFFRDCRLWQQFDMAMDYFSANDMRKIDNLLNHLENYLSEPGRPALVHGDLWSGNMIAGSDGKGWLIDPAVYYGHPEVDIAMTELFGGFSYQFYGSYKEAGYLDPGYDDRRDLYNLYHLLNHLNMFGRSYLSSVKEILNRYG